MKIYTEVLQYICVSMLSHIIAFSVFQNYKPMETNL